MDISLEKSAYQYKLWRIFFIGIPALLAAVGSLIFTVAAFFMGPKGFEVGTPGYIMICASGVIMVISTVVAAIWAITPVYTGHNNSENITESKRNAENREAKEMEEKGYPFSTPMVECDCNRPYGVIRRSGPSRH